MILVLVLSAPIAGSGFHSIIITYGRFHGNHGTYYKITVVRTNGHFSHLYNSLKVVVGDINR
jgi:hypothetical protein